VLRHHIAKSRQLSYSSSSGFQFSLSYLSFYDKLEKANYYFERSIELAQQSFDDRLVRYLNKSPMRDSGNWTSAVWLVKKYGLVPEDVFPESESSSNTETMIQILNAKIRENGLRLRELDTIIRQDPRFSDSSDLEAQKKTDEGRLEILRRMKTKYMGEIYNILTVCMGVPPTPNESFVWERYDKSKKYAYWTGTPIDFRKKYVDGGSGKDDKDPLDTIILANDPRYEYGKILVNERGRKYDGVELPMLLNVQSEVMRKVVVKVCPINLKFALRSALTDWLALVP
jgi:bleomycin hydrolase